MPKEMPWVRMPESIMIKIYQWTPEFEALKIYFTEWEVGSPAGRRSMAGAKLVCDSIF